MHRRPKADSPGQNRKTDEDRIAWVRLMLTKMRRQKALLPLFDNLLALQTSGQTPKGRVSKTDLTMVERYQAPNNGQHWEAAQEKFDACPRKTIMERRVWENVADLSRVLYDIYPPGYDDELKILVKSEGRDCWLTALNSTPKPEKRPDNKNPFPYWGCTIDDEAVDTGPIHLPTNPWLAARPKLSVQGSWKPPKSFADFSQFKSMRWEQYRGINPKCHNSPTLFFADFKRDNEAFEVLAKEGDYADYVATVKSLEDVVSLRDGRKMKVGDLLCDGWNSDKNLLPLPVASPVALDLMILTKQDTVLVCDDTRHQQWNVSASAIPNLASDDHGNDTSAVVRNAIRRRAHEELGLLIDPNEISWMAFGVGRKVGRTGLLGQIKLQKTEQKIRASFEDRRERDDGRGIEFVSLDVATVQKFLKTRYCSYFLRLGLHLCLWRKFPARVKISTYRNQRTKEFTTVTEGSLVKQVPHALR